MMMLVMVIAIDVDNGEAVFEGSGVVLSISTIAWSSLGYGLPALDS